ncbi:hypothetical protein Vadar_006881 [Vaccinium darrowii]|uniref:Uncharacterized protein n=1 Tax=Vaccinium darrowii TaxID=229202 RepID=A0ACB7ZAX0_9ERIC|nr:hypothetical protein Vadar_006881 [Vaccinium darrowii]
MEVEEDSPPDNLESMTFDEASMERSKSFVAALQELKNLRPQLYSAAEYCEQLIFVPPGWRLAGMHIDARVSLCSGNHVAVKDLESCTSCARCPLEMSCSCMTFAECHVGIRCTANHCHPGIHMVPTESNWPRCAGPSQTMLGLGPRQLRPPWHRGLQITDLLEQQTLDVSSMELKVSCLKQQLLTCQIYTDREGLRQQQLLAFIPRHHKHYTLPNYVHKKVQFSPHVRTDARQSQIQTRPRLYNSGSRAPTTLSWHLASETKSTLKVPSNVLMSNEDPHIF